MSAVWAGQVPQVHWHDPSTPRHPLEGRCAEHVIRVGVQRGGLQVGGSGESKAAEHSSGSCRTGVCVSQLLSTSQSWAVVLRPLLRTPEGCGGQVKASRALLCPARWCTLCVDLVAPKDAQVASELCLGMPVREIPEGVNVCIVDWAKKVYCGLGDRLPAVPGGSAWSSLGERKTLPAVL